MLYACESESVSERNKSRPKAKRLFLWMITPVS
jgi:hypothetical protein